MALQTGLAYAMLWERQKLFEVAGLKSELARQLERSSLRRFSVGEIARNAYLRAQLERARAEADEATAQAEFEQSLGLLNLLLGEKPERPLQLQTTLPDLGPPQGAGSAPARMPGAPEVIALSSEAAALQHQRDLAAKANSPELQFQIYQSRFFAADPVQGVQLTLNIPLWDWGQVEAEVGRRQGQAKAAEARLAERKLALQQRVLEVSKRYQAAQARVEILASQAEHLAKLAQDASRAYDANLMSMLEVFDVQQSYRLALQGYITAQAELARSGLELGALEPGGFFEEVAREQDH